MHSDCQNCLCDHSQSNDSLQASHDSSQKELLQYKEKLETTEKKVLYLLSDVENMRRSMIKEVHLRSEQNSIRLIKGILPLCDDIVGCVEAAKDTNQNVLREGLDLLYKNLSNFFEQIGIEKIDELTLFDPELHEILSSVPVNEEYKENYVIAVIRPGYKYAGKVVRPAQVVVAQ
jgi:molecular chaperone GrpE